MELAILADTHIPSRATAIPDAFEERIRDADHVVHAGDFDSEGAFATVRELATDLTAVAGNMDPAIGLQRAVAVELGGVPVVVTHGTGSKRGYEGRVAGIVHQELADGDDSPAGTEDSPAEPHGDTTPIAVAGHTHEVLDTVHDGVRILNPGSATGASPADRATMMTATVDGGTVDGETIDVRVHER